ncbi:MAG: DUF1800 domain-containing protein [Actinomycetota bacterium]
MISRLTFGATPELQAAVEAQGVAAWIEDQLSKTGPDPSVDGRFEDFVGFGGGTHRDMWIRYSEQGHRHEQAETTLSQVLRARHSDHQLYEMMCQLWNDHFSVYWIGSDRMEHLSFSFQEWVIRPHAMTNFRDLLKATAASPAMLAYLDNDRSEGNKSINENYGRELLELHTLGIKPDDTQVYNEADVLAASQVMSGWWLDRNFGNEDFLRVHFRDDLAYEGPISLLNGAWTRGNIAPADGADSMLDFLAMHPSTAEHVAYKICRRFVADQPPASLVQSAAQVYLANDTAIVPVLRHVFTSAEFAASEGQKFRRPFEVLVAMFRALHIDAPPSPFHPAKGWVMHDFLFASGNQPGTWETPDGFPDNTVFWLTTLGLLNRWNAAARLARNRQRGSTPDYGRLRPAAADVGELIEKLAVQFGIGALTGEDVRNIAQGAGVAIGDSAEVDDATLGDIATYLLIHPLFSIR